jgi:hypothetical protein
MSPTRRQPHAELVISAAGMYHMLNGGTGHESPFNLSDLQLFIPALGFERRSDCWNYNDTTCMDGNKKKFPL